MLVFNCVISMIQEYVCGVVAAMCIRVVVYSLVVYGSELEHVYHDAITNM